MDSSAVFNTSWLCTVPIRFLRTWRLAATAEPLSVRKSLRSRRLVVFKRKNGSWWAAIQVVRQYAKLLETSETTERITGSFVSWLHHRVLLSKRLLAICADMMNIMYIPWRSVMYLHLLDFACVRPEKHSNDLNTFNSSRLSDSNSLLALNLFCSRHVGWDVVWLVLKRPHTFPPLLAKAFSKWSILTNWHSDGSGMIW